MDKNYHLRSWWHVNDFQFTVYDPKMGLNGEGVYQIYGVADSGFQNSIGLAKGGLMSIYNDGAVEIHAGKKSNKGVDVQISTSNGDICLTADKTGGVRIRGNNMSLDCDGTLNINAGKDLNLKAGGGVAISANAANLKAQTGNIIPEGLSWSEKCYADSHVGSSAVRGYKAFIGLIK